MKQSPLYLVFCLLFIIAPIQPLLAQIKSIQRVSVSSSGAQANGASDGACLSSDGQNVAFRSEASNLIDTDGGGFLDVFIRDIKGQTTIRASQDLNNGDLNGDSGVPLSSLRPLGISADGQYVSYITAATNAFFGDDNLHSDAMVYSVVSNFSEFVSSDSSTNLGDADTDSAAISGDAEYVAFATAATDLIDADTNTASDVIRRTRQSAFIELISNKLGDATPANAASIDPSINSDGSKIAFASQASDLVSADTNGFADIFLFDYGAGTSQLISKSSGGTQGNAGSGMPFIAAGADYVVFESNASNLVSTDTNQVGDIFLFDQSQNATEIISIGRRGGPANGRSFLPSVGSDGRYVAFLSDATNLVEGDSNRVTDVFVRDRKAGVTLRVNLTSQLRQAKLAARDAQISADGKWVVFSSADSTLVADDTNAVSDVFLVEVNQVVTPDTVFEDPPQIGVSNSERKVTVIMPKFSKAAPPSSSAKMAARLSRAAARRRVTFDFRYDVRLNGQSGEAASDLRRRVTKRNEFTFRNLRPGSYSTNFRVNLIRVTRRNNGDVRKRLLSSTAFSPSNGFSIE